MYLFILLSQLLEVSFQGLSFYLFIIFFKHTKPTLKKDGEGKKTASDRLPCTELFI